MEKSLQIGCHMSTSKGFDKTVQQAKNIGANTFQFFPRSPRGTKSRTISTAERDRFQQLIDKKDFFAPVMHGAYTMNLCSDREDIRELAVRLITEDIEKMLFLGIDRYVFHPGSHVKQGSRIGCDQIIDGLNKIFSNFDGLQLKIALEGMSGKGTEIGRNLEELRYIIDHVPYAHLGVCLDTCHLYSAGYDIRSDAEVFYRTLEQEIGLEKVHIIHLNDSKTSFHSNKDRHEQLGKGSLGFEAIYDFCHRSEFQHIPKILETPHDSLQGYELEISKLRGLYENSIKER